MKKKPPLRVSGLCAVIVLSFATSIDALAVRYQFRGTPGSRADPVHSLSVSSVLGISFAGVMLGERLESVLGNKMEIFGGVILILIGLRILYGHTRLDERSLLGKDAL